MLEFHNTALNGGPAHRLPSVDIHEENGDLVLRAQVPGLMLGEVDLAIDHGDLVIEGDGWDDTEIGHEHYEHLHGRLPLPFAADPSRLASQVTDDVLEVHIPILPSPGGEEWALEEIAF
jgi:HSP20 family molecular chaperone IbpA